MSEGCPFPVRIALCGFAGSGKSTIAPLLARSLGYSMTDTDIAIARQAGRSVADVFSHSGERSFRNIEQGIIRKVLLKKKVIIALGGGALLHPPTLKRIQRETILIYLSCSTRELSRRLRHQHDRPLLAEAKGSHLSLQERISRLLNLRRPGYQMATLMISTSRRSPQETVKLIRLRLSKKRLI